MTTRRRTVEWEDPAALADAGRRLGGRAFLEAMRDGKLPPPPIAKTLGIDFTEVDDGRAVFEFQPAEFHYNPLGSVQGGVPAVMFDAVSALKRASETDASHSSRPSAAPSSRASRTAWATRRWS